MNWLPRYPVGVDFALVDLLEGRIGLNEQHHAGVTRTAWDRRSRPWWVCCFGRANKRRYYRRWDLAQSGFYNGKRFLPLAEVKTFETLRKAHASASYNRQYAPFNDPNAIVLLLHCASVRPDGFIQFTLGNSYD